jgi:hypothetical protein
MQLPSNDSHFWFYARLYDAKGEVKLFNRALDVATRQTPRRNLTNTDFLKQLLEEYVAAHKDQVRL